MSDSPELFDLSRLTVEERQLWEEHFTGSLGPDDSMTVRVWGFGYWCMLALERVPKPVSEWLREHDPDNQLRQYLENVRRARWEGRI